MALATNLGYPRIGPNRELKSAVEGYWAGAHDAASMRRRTRELRGGGWSAQAEAGLDQVPVGDFSLYDHVLDTCAMFGLVPPRFGWRGGELDLDTYFAMARGLDGEQPAAAMEMTKWFDTNYHYLVPELQAGQRFRLIWPKPVEALMDARTEGVPARPVVLGPVSFLLLSKMAEGSAGEPLDLLENILPAYEQLLELLAEEEADWVQIDEPALVLDLSENARRAFDTAYKRMVDDAQGLNLLLTTYFGSVGDNLTLVARLPVAGLHVDLVHGTDTLEALLAHLPPSRWLSLGLVDGRNVWRTDLESALQTAERAAEARDASRLMIGPSCSLLHSPLDLRLERRLDEELKGWLAFARQKLDEIVLIARGVTKGRAAVADALAANVHAMAERGASMRIHDPEVKERVGRIGPRMRERDSAYPTRRRKQQAVRALPPLPTTTIGSFPQTHAVRRARGAHKRGEIDEATYAQRMREEIERVIRAQEEAGLDVLVHGEPERADMVEHFAAHMEGFAATEAGWIQSYGTRCVKPPLLFGDVRRKGPMTVDWMRYAQSLTERPVKGMLTGPVTILEWSLVRDDQPRSETCRQIALAIRDEVADLEGAGLGIIQIDEPAFREGLPLRAAGRDEDLAWAVACFRIASCPVRDETQIHTHMCYSEFNDMTEAIAALDADVLSVEASRSAMTILDAFRQEQYPNEFGPGVWDIHSPIVPDARRMADLIRKTLDVFAPEQVWVNPDCGLKTRNWEEAGPALAHMVSAAKEVRGELVEAVE